MHSILLTVLIDLAFAAAPTAAVVMMWRQAAILRAAGAMPPVRFLSIGLIIWAVYKLLDAIALLAGPFFLNEAELASVTQVVRIDMRWPVEFLTTVFLIIGFVWLFRRMIEIMSGLQLSHEALETELDNSSEREAELKERANTERAQSQSRSEFVLGLSHELRTPLNGILGLSSLLSNTDLDSSQRKLLATIDRSAHAMLSRVSDVLDLARLENNRVELRSVAFRPDELARTVVGLFQPLAGEKGVTLALEVAEGAAVAVLGDPVRVRQILNNLVSNAVKFTPQGSVTLTVSHSAESGPKSWVEFQVTDTGVGMDEALLARLSNQSGTAAGGDSGLGLSICRRLARLMDGDMTVESQPGAGTTVTVRIRVQDEPVEQS